MPVYFIALGYKLYFWSEENDEGIHVHISKGKPTSNATKVWILSDGSLFLAHNKSRVPEHELNKLLKMIQRNSSSIIREWCSYFNVAPKFYK